MCHGILVTGLIRGSHFQCGRFHGCLQPLTVAYVIQPVGQLARSTHWRLQAVVMSPYWMSTDGLNVATCILLL